MELILTNKDGQTLDLLNDPRFVLTACEGLHGIETDIATSDNPFEDGVEVENVKALPRGIQFTFAVLPDIAQNIVGFTNVVKSKQYVTLTQTENDRNITIKGIATLPPYTRMVGLCKIQLTIYCAKPYWEDVASVVGTVSMYLPLLYFPVAGQYFTPTGRPFSAIDLTLSKTFVNNGDASVGMDIYITALDTVQNPRLSCSTGDQNGWYMQLNVTLSQGDEVHICTKTGQKSVTINNSSTYNGQPVLSYLTFVGGNWLQLETGSNTFNVTAATGADMVYFTVVYNRRYE